jgi:flagellin
MALRINTNVAAINTHRQLLGTEATQSKSMERLSSGFRINRASDDAAGLAVANRLRATIKSFGVASRNVSEAKAMVNVAEGAANQLSGILDRMKELATQSASDNAANDRDKLQAEYLALQQEITRITDDTDYQGVVLLKGGFGNAVSGTSAGFTTANGATSSDVKINGAAAGTYTISDAGGIISMTDGTNSQAIALATATAGTLNFSMFNISIAVNSQHATADLNASSITVTAGSNGGVFQVGTSNQTWDTIGLQIGDVSLGSTGLNLATTTSNVSTRSAASTALAAIDTARDALATVLGNIGAVTNRLDYSYNNIQIAVENYSASESVIRDVDMASEMVSFTKTQIMMQAGTAMLAQANTSSQGVLSLFR